MAIFIPKTRGQWIATVAAVLAAVLVLYFFTDVFKGHAVEVSLENASASAVFAYIDNTGRHGKSTATVKLKTKTGGETPLGLLIQPTTTRSFGMAVGIGDSPTLHVLPVDEAGAADRAGAIDCPFDTVQLKKLEVPSLHVKIRWAGRCEVQPR